MKTACRAREHVARLASRTTLSVALLLAGAGCVKAPERIEVNLAGNARPAPVDSGRVPEPATLDEARQELARAYDNIRYLESDRERLERKANELKRERDDARKRLKKYEDD